MDESLLRKKLNQVIELKTHAKKDDNYPWWFELSGAEIILKWVLEKREEPYKLK